MTDAVRRPRRASTSRQAPLPPPNPELKDNLIDRAATISILDPNLSPGKALKRLKMALERKNDVVTIRSLPLRNAVEVRVKLYEKKGLYKNCGSEERELLLAKAWGEESPL